MKVSDFKLITGLHATVLVGCCLATLILSACSSSDEPETPAQPIVLEGGSRAVAKELPDFAAKLFLNVLENSSEENVVMSPLSAFMTLGMVANCVDDAARQEILDALGNGSDIADVNALCAKWMETLPSLDRKCTVNLANGVWWNKSINLPAGYKDKCGSVLRNYFSADIYNAAFQNSTATLSDINKWCSSKTHGNINHILNSLREDAIGVWLNALFFEGKWNSIFLPGDTAPGTFTTEQGEKLTVDMMSGSVHVAHCGSDDFDALSLEYGNSMFRMLIVIPSEDKTLADINDEVTGKLLSNFILLGDESNLRPYYIELKMPKFHSESEINLINPLKKMGVRAIFDTDVFGEVAGQKGKIGILHQKVVADTDENGSKVAAATVATDAPTGVELKDKFNVDRPFYYFIYEHSTGAILVAGRMMRP